MWVNSCFRPRQGGYAAKALFDQGADIIAATPIPPRRCKIAEERRACTALVSVGHDQVRPQGAYTAIATTGRRTTPAASRNHRRHLEADQCLGRQSRRARCSWRPIRTCPRMSPGRGGNRADDRLGRAASLHRSHHGPVRRGEIPAGAVVPDADLLGMTWYVQGSTTSCRTSAGSNPTSTRSPPCGAGGERESSPASGFRLPLHRHLRFSAQAAKTGTHEHRWSRRGRTVPPLPKLRCA